MQPEICTFSDLTMFSFSRRDKWRLTVAGEQVMRLAISAVVMDTQPSRPTLPIVKDFKAVNHCKSFMLQPFKIMVNEPDTLNKLNMAQKAHRTNCTVDKLYTVNLLLSITAKQKHTRRRASRANIPKEGMLAATAAKCVLVSLCQGSTTLLTKMRGKQSKPLTR